MSDTQVTDREDGLARIIDSVEDLERSALEAVRATMVGNVEMGLSMRVMGDLRDEQDELGALEDEIREAMKPKKKKPVHRPKKPGIEIMHLN